MGVALSLAYLVQVAPLWGLPREIHVAAGLCGAMIWFAARGFRVSQTNLTLALGIIGSSILLAPSFTDVAAIVTKIGVCLSVFFLVDQCARSRLGLRWIEIGLWAFFLIEALARITCMMPTLEILLLSPIAYKTGCSKILTDGNAIGNLLVMWLAVRLIAGPKGVRGWFAVGTLLVLVAMSASKAAMLGSALSLLAYLYWRCVPARTAVMVVLLLLFLSATILFTLGAEYLGRDPSYAAKIANLRYGIDYLFTNPQELLFGHGYYTGARFLATHNFAHAAPLLLVGTSGLVGTLLCLLWFYRNVVTGPGAWLLVVAISIPALSYFPPFFDYHFAFFALAARTAAQAQESFVQRRVQHSRAAIRMHGLEGGPKVLDS